MGRHLFNIMLVVASLWSMPVYADAGAADVTPAADPLLAVTVKDGVAVNTANEVVNEAANLLAKCGERKVALEACPGGFKGIACRKALELGRYRGLECPDL